MPDGFTTEGSRQQTAQRGFRSAPRGRFPGRFPIRRRFPRPIVFPFFFGFPAGRCYYIDRFGRCCDRYGRCCDRYGRCSYPGGTYPFAGAGSADDWYGVAGGWDMMPDVDDMDDGGADSAAAFNEFTDYDY